MLISQRIKSLRQGKEDWLRFKETINESDLSKISLRWLKSTADSYADHGTKEERLGGLIISMFSTCFKIADSGNGGELYDGVMNLSTHDDTMGNLLHRVRRELPANLQDLWEEVLTRTAEQSPTIQKKLKHTPCLMEETFYGK